jgi:nitrite reductase/ring-hydroxylating ferredoxin subunit
MPDRRWLRVCSADDLRDGEDGVRFALTVGGAAATGFVVRHAGAVRGYLNRCAHVAMELDWQPGRFYDADGQWLLCATHGALYEPSSGRCAGGPCAGRGGLRPIRVIERDGSVLWAPDGYVEPPQEERTDLR